MHVNVYGFEWVCEHSLYVLWPHKGTSGHRSLCLCMCECISADFFHVLYFPFLFSVFYSVSVLFLIVLRIHLMMVHLKGFYPFNKSLSDHCFHRGTHYHSVMATHKGLKESDGKAMNSFRW